MRHRLLTLLLLLGAMAVVTACPGKPPAGDDDDDATPTPGDEITQSSKSNVRFKRNERLRNDLAVGLELQLGEVCNELGQYSCTDFVHAVALGGLAPYTLGITRPPEQTGANTPIVTDRVVLSACRTRVDRDLATPASAVIFGNLNINGGELDVSDPTVEDAINELYKRAVQREARANEIATLQSLYTDIEAISNDPARDWAVASCFAVFTTTEALFY